MFILSAILYVTAIAWFSSSMCNPDRPYMNAILVCLLASAFFFGFCIYRRLYGKRR